MTSLLPEEIGVAVLLCLSLLVGLYFLLRLLVTGRRTSPSVNLTEQEGAVTLIPLHSGNDGSIVIETIRHLPPAARVLCIYFITVPRSLALDGAMPDEEEQAAQTLATCVAHAREQGITITPQVRRARNPVDEAIRVVQDTKVTLVVLPPDSPVCEIPFATPFIYRAPCPILFLFQKIF
jgi:hypothetical protein